MYPGAPPTSGPPLHGGRMTTNTGDWTLSPNAAEFLPEELDELKRGTMTICPECHWPRGAAAASCDKCPAYRSTPEWKPDPTALAGPVQ